MESVKSSSESVKMVSKAKEIIERKYVETLKEIGEKIVEMLSEKYKFDRAEALEYLEIEGTEKMNKERGERGRPKKEKKTQKGNKVNVEETTAVGDDLIASLIAEAEETVSSGSGVSGSSSETESVAESTSTTSSKKGKKMTDAEKAEKLAAKEAERRKN